MTERDTDNNDDIAYLPSLWQFGRRVLATAFVWTGFGLVVGVLIAPPGPIGAVAGCIAGMIVLTPLGVLLGLIGGRWKETLLCGLVGFVLGTTGGAWGDAARTGYFAAAGLVYGGVVGATFVSLFYRLPRLVFGLIRKRA
jgi:hypothetical protein